ncbi:hypothetical protein JW711_06105 [Candidatus Woesearchaeota archaeon]|nr:hypothetical protein [Candidatus Woesearchaeota archaeon]
MHLEDALELIDRADTEEAWREDERFFYANLETKTGRYVRLLLRPADAQPEKDLYTLEVSTSGGLIENPRKIAEYTDEKLTPIYARIVKQADARYERRNDRLRRFFKSGF